jgi:hypothetical protein
LPSVGLEDPAPVSTTPATTTTTEAKTATTSTSTTTLPPPPPVDATQEEKQQFEEQVDIYASDDYTDYIPAGSTVSVAQRRTVVAAAGTALGLLPTIPARRRTR